MTLKVGKPLPAKLDVCVTGAIHRFLTLHSESKAEFGTNPANWCFVRTADVRAKYSESPLSAHLDILQKMKSLLAFVFNPIKSALWI